MNRPPLVRFVLQCALLPLGLGIFGIASAAEKVTFEDHILPILRNSCLKCHNPDKLKGDLDLTTVSGTLKGGGSGAGVVSGDPDASKMYRAITHAEEPNMPPNSGKLPDQEIDLIKRWIMGGLLENAGSRGFAPSKPKVDLNVPVATFERPEGPPPMPQDLLLEPVTRTDQTSVSTALASSPWAPLIALGGQKQVLLYDSTTLDLMGILPFPEGYPQDLKFSRNGKLLLVGGGRAGKSGLAVVWDVRNGQRITTVGDEFDTALAVDISADQNWIALGGPSRLVKIFSTQDGVLHHKLKKHTDWVTALEFSPNGKFLATGDRNGGLMVWEAASGQEHTTFTGHKGSITSLGWRSDSDLLMSASEDGTVKLWKLSDGQLVRSWTAHAGGVLSAKSTRDGRIVSCGRDHQIVLWDAEGTRQRSIPLPDELPVRVTFSQDGGRVIGCDWAGKVLVWNSADGKQVGQLASNPPSLAEQSEAAARRVAELQHQAEQANMAHTASMASVAQLKAEIGATQKSAANDPALTRQVDAAVQKSKESKAAADRAEAEWLRAKSALPRFKAAQSYALVYRAQTELTVHQQGYDRWVAELATARTDAENATRELAEVRRTTANSRAEKAEQAQRMKSLNEVIKTSAAKAVTFKAAIEKLSQALVAEQARLEKLTADYQRLKSDPNPAPTAAKL